MHHVQADLEGYFTLCQCKWLPLSSHTHAVHFVQNFHCETGACPACS